MEIHTASLSAQLRFTLSDIERQIDAVNKNAAHPNSYLGDLDALMLNKGPREDQPARDTFKVQDRNGRPVLTDLLLAKSNCLLALSNLQKPAKK